MLQQSPISPPANTKNVLITIRPRRGSWRLGAEARNPAYGVSNAILVRGALASGVSSYRSSRKTLCFTAARVERRVRRQSEPTGYLTWCLANSSGVNLPAFT